MQYPIKTSLWIIPTSFMVIATYAYAKLRAPSGITRDNVDNYLIGHIALSSLTGVLWGGLAIYFLDWSSEYTLFVSCTIVATISIGGMLPGATYRPGFIGLATFMMVPFGLYSMATGHGPLRLIGVGTLILYAFGLLTSARAQQNTRTGISAQRERELSEKIARQNTVIQRAHDEKTRFLAATSHDLSQPLHAQGFFIQALRKSLKTKPQIELLAKIEDSWRSQKQLLKGLADITRLDSGVVIPNVSIFNPSEAISSLMDEFIAATNGKSINLETHFDDVYIQSDAVLLTRILRNILSNAVKYTPKNGRIIFQIRKTARSVNIIIRDNGIGIPKEEHENIFEEYVQLGNANRNREKGLGLGLSIVQRLTTLLDIKLSLQSALGDETQFTLSMPRYKQDLNVKAQGNGTKNDNFNYAPLVVLVDDEKAIREGMAALLTDWGCQIISSSSGGEAIKLLSNTTEIPILLIIDKWLAHGENGLDVISTLREEVNEVTPAILITGDIKGFGDITPSANITLMAKPVEPNEVRRVIEDLSAR